VPRADRRGIEAHAVIVHFDVEESRRWSETVASSPRMPREDNLRSLRAGVYAVRQRRRQHD
jgi:hypothetical protein